MDDGDERYSTLSGDDGESEAGLELGSEEGLSVFWRARMRRDDCIESMT